MKPLKALTESPSPDNNTMSNRGPAFEATKSRRLDAITAELDGLNCNPMVESRAAFWRRQILMRERRRLEREIFGQQTQGRAA